MRLVLGIIPVIFIANLAIAANNIDSHGVILVYHHVSTDTPPSTSISPEDFRKHLDYLQQNNFSVIPLDQMLETLQTGGQLPEKAIAITFDDGYISIYDTAFPMLQSYGFPFTLFLSTGPIDRRQQSFMNWEQVKKMSEAGVIIANHMVEHPYMLDKGPGESEAQWISRLENELLTAEARIEQQTGQSHRYLAYPFGEFNADIKTMLGANGFIGLAQNSGAIGVNSDFLSLPRFPLASIYANLDTAKIKLDSKSFNVELMRPQSPITDIRNPSVTLKFNDGNYNLSQIGCFANSQPLPMTWIDRDEGILLIQPTEDYTGRRWRYLCTAPVPGESRYYWYSIQWINVN
ncbi:MAG: hypothetical protein CMQ30_06955 [Gammaproteobacteria bacterium]|nr:hypothetical protein [Gammaproteobacteria bacterium]